MKILYCSTCGKRTGHKRALGVGTFVALVCSLGWWLLALPFYPMRCIICGNDNVAAKAPGIAGALPKPWFKRWWGLCICAFIVLVFIQVALQMAGFGTAKQKPAVPKIDRVILTVAGKTIKAKYRAWPDDICNYVAQKQIVKGMTREQVRAAWGKPTLISKQESPDVSQEVWLYGTWSNGAKCSFVGDTLITWVNESLRH